MQVEYKNGFFHLYNEKISYIMKIMKNMQLSHLYFGKRLNIENFNHLYYEKDVPQVSINENEQCFSMATMRQEFSTYGTTDFSNGSYKITQENGSCISDFRYSSHEIVNFKKKVRGLPMSFGNCKTLIIKLVDDVINVEMTLYYSIFKANATITKHVEITNLGSEKIQISHLMSGQLDFDTSDFTMLQLDGAWSRERFVTKRKITYGITQIESQLGASGHIQNPAFALLKDDATEFHGEVFGFNFLYSGSHIGKVEVGSHNRTRVTVGIHPDTFNYTLYSGDEFISPEMITTYSNNGLNELSHEMHYFIKNHVQNPITKFIKTPILTNNWEATNFDFNEKKILEMAQNAKKVGVELFVLDDGWFGNRNDDNSSLGDWTSNLKKLPDGIEGLSKKITNMNMKFGIWFEPEMISKRSELYEEHPDYAIKTPDRRMSFGRNQFVLDFSNPKVVDYIFEKMSLLLDKSHISYIKWDMNRNITEPYGSSLAPKRQGEFFHRYILGVYDLYEKLIEKYPEIIFESCAAGGGRFDLGMLYYSPQIWTSDNTDPVERLRIQYGTSIFYPLKSIGNHVTSIKSHQTGRFSSLDFKASVAFFGNFGYELDMGELKE